MTLLVPSACHSDKSPVDRALPCDATPEVCNGVDDDCDGMVDEGASDAVALHADLDGDGFGAGELVTTCPTVGLTADATAYDDTDPATFPGAEDIRYDGVDQDCDGVDRDCTDAGAVYEGTLLTQNADYISTRCPSTTCRTWCRWERSGHSNTSRRPSWSTSPRSCPSTASMGWPARAPSPCTGSTRSPT